MGRYGEIWAQVRCVRRALEAAGQGEGVMVGTVDGAQGAESDLVILSFVRANCNVPLCTGPSNPEGRGAPSRTLVATLVQPVSTSRSLPRPSARLLDPRPSALWARVHRLRPTT